MWSITPFTISRRFIPLQVSRAECLRRLLLPALVVLGMLSAGTATAATTTIKCWCADEYDLDADGYADMMADSKLIEDGGGREEFVVPRGEGTCPGPQTGCAGGYVKKRGDCDDNDADIHPRRREVYGNDVDDDCDGSVDEAEFGYASDTRNVTDDSITMDIDINDPDVVAASSLYYAIEYESLSATSATPDETEKRSLDAVSVHLTGNIGGDQWLVGSTTVTLDGLDANTVYRARVVFYEGSLYAGGPWGDWGGGVTYTQIGTESDWYYTMTTGNGALRNARAAIVIAGLYEFYLSENHGAVGYHGLSDEDGTAYGADVGEAWCSEFYSWVIGTEVPSMGSLARVSGLKDWFTDWERLVEVSDPADFIDDARPGDYMAEVNNDGDFIHSAMFLTYDVNTDTCWTLDGNVSGITTANDSDGNPLEEAYQSRKGGSEVWVREQDCSVVGAWGDLHRDML